MATDICLVCLISIKGINPPFDFHTTDENKSKPGLNKRFLKFVSNYFKISTDGLIANASVARNCFCTTCGNGIRSVCELYLELLAVELRLSSKLGELKRLLESSRSVESNRMRFMLSIASLADQLGVKGQSSQVSELRSLLNSKCKANQEDYLPDVTINRFDLQINMRCNEFSYEDNDYDDLNDVDLGSTSHEEVVKQEIVALDEEIGTPREADVEHDKLEGKEFPTEKNCVGNQTKREVYKIIIKNEVFEEENQETDNEVTKLFKVDSEPDNDSDPDWRDEGMRSVKKSKSAHKVLNEASAAEKLKRDVEAKKTVFAECSKEPRSTSKRISCSECHVSFANNSNLQKHMTAIHNPQHHDCPECELVFPAKRYLHHHLPRIHPHIFQQLKRSKHLRAKGVKIGGETKFPCPACPKQFSTRSYMLSHKRRVHDGMHYRYRCPECNIYIRGKLPLEHHINSVHKNDKYCCTKCQKTFKSANHLTEHSFQAHPQPSLLEKCPKCEKRFYCWEAHSKPRLQ